MTADKHEELALSALDTAEQYRGWRGRESDIAIVGSYSSLALAHFAAADMERRKETTHA